MAQSVQRITLIAPWAFHALLYTSYASVLQYYQYQIGAELSYRLQHTLIDYLYDIMLNAGDTIRPCVRRPPRDYTVIPFITRPPRSTDNALDSITAIKISFR
ncbi:hypothetical protein J6590_002031 [Homalodisca vitripennis]|nr:hypothetical protein J6590_002031 [Homalodisca vitripennis]